MNQVLIKRDGATLTGVDVGIGPPILFQHGLGGNEQQAAEVFPSNHGYRRLTLECRGHGSSELGRLDQLSFTTFADDLLAFLDEAGTERVVAGGISMGAALALRLAVIAPQRVRALVLARPAWVTKSSPDNLSYFRAVGLMLDDDDREAARLRFAASPEGRLLASEAPDNFKSLNGLFAATRPPWTGSLVRALAADGPGITEGDVKRIKVPTLVIGHGRDLAHPLAYSKALVELIPNAQLVEVTPKANDTDAYRLEFRTALVSFLDSLPAPVT